MSNLPESIKVAYAYIAMDTSIEGTKFLVTLGDNEVLILLSFYYWWGGVLAAGENHVDIGIWRKTDTNPPSFATTHSDLIWAVRDRINFVTESVRAGNSEHIIFPYPMILIRPPRLVTRRTTLTAASVEMRLYYLIQKVSDEELAKLMVKDHA